MSNNPKPPVPKRTSSTYHSIDSVEEFKREEKHSVNFSSLSHHSDSSCCSNNIISDEILDKISDMVIERSVKKRASSKSTVSFQPDESIIKLNIGGTNFSTLRQTLDKQIPRIDNKNQFYESNLFQEMFAGKVMRRYDENHAIFIDRNPQFFNIILDYLRQVDTPHPLRLPTGNDMIKSIFEEAQFYKLESLKDKIYSICMNSSIMNEVLTATLFRVCKLRAQKWNLIYRATRDGFFSSSFHTACDSAGTTLVLVKSSTNFIFGGCTLLPWDDYHGATFKEDPNAFIFSLVNRLNKSVRINVCDSKKAIKVRHDYGPVFGDDDFALFLPAGSFYMSEHDTTCYSALGKSYKLSVDMAREVKVEEFLAGSSHFKPIEVEVFAIAK